MSTTYPAFHGYAMDLWQVGPVVAGTAVIPQFKCTLHLETISAETTTRGDGYGTNSCDGLAVGPGGLTGWAYKTCSVTYVRPALDMNVTGFCQVTVGIGGVWTTTWPAVEEMNLVLIPNDPVGQEMVHYQTVGTWTTAGA